jgi:hypothetical protein
MDELEIKQGSFIQQTQYFIQVEIDLSSVSARLRIFSLVLLDNRGFNILRDRVLKQASTLTFVRLPGTSENWCRTSRSCITVVQQDKWKNPQTCRYTGQIYFHLYKILDNRNTRSTCPTSVFTGTGQSDKR